MCAFCSAEVPDVIEGRALDGPRRGAFNEPCDGGSFDLIGVSAYRERSIAASGGENRIELNCLQKPVREGDSGGDGREDVVHKSASDVEAISVKAALSVFCLVLGDRWGSAAEKIQSVEGVERTGEVRESLHSLLLRLSTGKLSMPSMHASRHAW